MEISTAKEIDFQSKLLLAVRIALALVWLYNGLWLKVIELDAHHLKIVAAAASGSGMQPEFLLRLIGSCETLLALGILSGLFFRFVNYFQIFIVLAMNLVGGISSGGEIPHPFGLIISNLPLIMCALVLIHFGPGALALRFKR